MGLRLSVTELETLRYHRDSDSSTLDSLLADLRKERPPTQQMEAGRAFAKLLEGVEEGRDSDVITVDGWEFDFTRAEFNIAWPKSREIKAEVPYDTPSGPVVLVGQVDAINGRAIHDAKLTENIDAEKYLDSRQWRAYLAMFKCGRFTYDLFRAKYTRNGDNIARRVEIVDYMAISFYAYPGLEADVQRDVNDLAAVVTKYLPERITKETP